MKIPADWRGFSFLLGIALCRVLVHADGDPELHHLIEVVDGVLHILRDGTLREGLEVKQTGIAPPVGIAGLDAELTLHLRETLAIDIGLYGIPYGEEMTSLMKTIVVLMAELIPEGTTTLHLIVPGHMMEPGDHVLRTGIDVVEGLAEVGGILLDVTTAVGGAVETESDTVGLVVVWRCPVRAKSLWGVPGLWTIVVTTGKDMMDPQRHHVAYTGLTAVEHHLLHRIHKFRLARKGLAQQLVGNLLGGEFRVPGQTTEGIPVGLCEVVSASVHIIADVGNSCHRLQTGGLHE